MSDVIQFPKIVVVDTMAQYGLTDTDEAAANIEMSDLYAPVIKSAATNSQQTKSNKVTDFVQNSDSTTGWSNQELADLYRAQRILALTGIAIDVDYGVTDEGDPWFVFMDSQDEVFAHFSHFDGFYMVSSLLQKDPIKGRSLQDLVYQFSELATPAAADASTEQSVISIMGRNRNVVLIHPAAALAALVWSIYLISDSLVASPQMTAEGSPAADINIEAIPDFKCFANISATELEVTQTAAQALSTLNGNKQVVDQHLVREFAGTSGASGMSVKALGMGLSFVALSVGLPMPREVKGATDSEHMLKSLSIDKLAKLLVEAQDIAAMTIERIDTALIEKTKLLHQAEHSTSVQTPPITDALGADDKIDIAVIVGTTKVSYDTKTQSSLEVQQQADLSVTEAGGISGNSEANTMSQSAAGVSQASVEISGNNDTSFLERFDATFENTALVDLTQINKDSMIELLNGSDSVDIPDLIIDVEEAQKYDAYDQNAQIFLDYLLRTYNDIKIVSLPTEVIFIHTDADETTGDSYELYAKSWSFEDGGIITTIGLKSDMVLFDLVA